MDATVMRKAKRLVITAAVAMASLWALLVPAAHAQEIQVKGPLAGAPAVIGMRVYREMRFQLQLQATMTLQDEYSRTILGGGQLMFHPTDWLGVGIWGGFGLAHLNTFLTDQVTEKGQTNDVNVLSLPSAKAFPNQIATISWMAAPQVAFIPLRGKLGIFEKLFIDTDLYLLGGVAFVGLKERAPVSKGVFDACKTMSTGGGGATSGNLGAEIGCFSNTQSNQASRTTIAPTFGVGISLYMTDFLAMTIEWRAMPFAWNTSGTDESGDARGDYPDDRIDEKDRLSHFNHMLTLGFAFYLPAEPGHSMSEESVSSSSSSSSTASSASGSAHVGSKKKKK
jgi:hypothetical protein